jgi:polyhydroxyalkanoate synthesis regulator phasin
MNRTFTAIKKHVLNLLDWEGGGMHPEHGGYVSQNEFLSAIENLWEYVLQQTDQINKLGAESVATQADVDALTGQVTTLDGQVTSLTSALQSQDAAVQNAITNIQAEITALQNANPQLDLTALQGAVTQLGTDAATAASTDTALGTDVTNVDNIAPQQ